MILVRCLALILVTAAAQAAAPAARSVALSHLEALDSPAQQDWWAAQEARTAAAVDPDLQRHFAARIAALGAHEEPGLPDCAAAHCVWRTRAPDGSVRWWSGAMDRPARELQAPPTIRVSDLRLAPDGRRAAWATAEGWQVVDLEDPVRPVELLAGALTEAGLAWHASGSISFVRRTGAGHDLVLRTSGGEERILRGLPAAPRPVFTPDATGRLTALDPESGALLWFDAAGADQRVALDGPSGARAERLALVRDRFAVVWRDGLRHRLFWHDAQGRRLGEVALPEVGTVLELRGGTVLHFAFTSYTRPRHILRVAPGARRATPVHTGGLALRGFRTRVVQLAAHDGAAIPLVLVDRAGADDAPLLLYVNGYRGYGTPNYASTIAAWLEQGGRFAMVDLAADGRHGLVPQAQARQPDVEHARRDLDAVVDGLARDHGVPARRLVLHGGHHTGGILVARLVHERPRASAGVWTSSGPMDLLAIAGAAASPGWWQVFGDATTEAGREQLRRWSPLENLPVDGGLTPHLLTDSSPQMPGWHAAKYVEAARIASAGRAPVYLRRTPRDGDAQANLVTERAVVYALYWTWATRP